VEATQQWQKYDKLRPDYNQYVDKLKVIEAAQKEEEIKKIELIKKQQENNTTKTN